MEQIRKFGMSASNPLQTLARLLVRERMANKFSLCACVLLWTAGLPTHARAAPLAAALAHKPYQVIRSKLIGLRYRPVKFIHANNPCLHGQTFCGRYREIISCSGTGLAMCEFAWTRSGKYFAVTTTGELTPTFNAIRQVSKREREEGWGPIAH